MDVLNDYYRCAKTLWWTCLINMFVPITSRYSSITQGEICDITVNDSFHLLCHFILVTGMMPLLFTRVRASHDIYISHLCLRRLIDRCFPTRVDPGCISLYYLEVWFPVLNYYDHNIPSRSPSDSRFDHPVTAVILDYAKASLLVHTTINSHGLRNKQATNLRLYYLLQKLDLVVYQTFGSSQSQCLT